jgi:hypothetical protein
MKPMPSFVFALMLILLGVMPVIAKDSFIASIKGEILGCSVIIVVSTQLTAYPFITASSTTYLSSSILTASFHFGSLSGKCPPISPSPSAPIIESVIA